MEELGTVFLGKSTKNDDIYYKTDGLRSGRVVIVSYEEYLKLIEKKIVYENAVFQTIY